MQVVKIFRSVINKKKRQLIEILRFGKDDVQEIEQISPVGFDSAPIANMRAIYGKTTSDGDSVIIGYFNENALASPGESRMFAVDKNGNLKTYIWAKNDGTLEVGGADDFMVRFNKLNEGVIDFQTQIQAELAKIAVGITGAGGSYTPGTLNVDISDSKIDEIKTS